MAQLPMEIVHIIQKMACDRQHNGKKGRDFIIRCHLKPLADDPQNTAVKMWLLSRLKLIKHAAVYNGQYYWNVTFDLHMPPNICICFIHFGTPPKKKNELIITDEKEEYYEMSSNYMLEFLSNEPEYVVGIGVSAVSPKYMETKWWKKVYTKNEYNTMYILHSSQSEGKQWSPIRLSFNEQTMGGYPPLTVSQEIASLKHELKWFIHKKCRSLQNGIDHLERII